MRPPIVFTRKQLSIESLAHMENSILLDPHYQRQGDVWTANKSQLLIDSILNGFIVPPMYWHTLDESSEYAGTGCRYAVVDGRQRLEALFGFLKGRYGLAPGSALFAEPSTDLSGLRFGDLRARYSWLFSAFMTAPIDVVFIETADVDLIEELFSRLNEGVPLKAAERRNRGRVLAPKVREMTESHVFFTNRLPFGNQRYRHQDLLAKFMRLEERGLRVGRIPDLKKVDLDRLFERLRALESQADEGAQAIDSLISKVGQRLDTMADLFGDRDRFLGSVGMVTLYYATVLYFEERGLPDLTRPEVDRFEALRQSIKWKDDADYDDVERLVSEFASYSQGPTSGSYLTARLRILVRVASGLNLSDIT